MNMMSIPALTDEIRDSEVRTLRWRNKQLGKQLGKAGQKIHELRCQLAEVREINGKIGRGLLRDLERQAENDRETIVELRILLERADERNAELRDKLQASEVVVTDARA